MDLTAASYFLFLGFVAVVHAVAAPRWRVPWLLGASVFFYGQSSLEYLLVVLMLGTANYWAALNLSRAPAAPGRAGVFGKIVALNLAVLVIFKYLRELLETLPVSVVRDVHWPLGLTLAAPLGISYFTFQMVACVTDAYRQDWKLAPGWGRFILFGLFFPQITSGPISRAGQLLPQLTAAARPTAEDCQAALRLMAYGLFKKFVVANHLGPYVAEIFGGRTEVASVHFSVLPTALGCIFNALNLYADFSGYVDIARGSARLLGIQLPLNFDRPFISTSVTEFWRRWHMTLSFWLRDYLYLPLVIRVRHLGLTGVALALVFTFAICGLWHGATWPYVVFGVAQGVALALETLSRRPRARWLKRWPARTVQVAGWIYAMTFFVLSEVVFRASSLANAGQVYAGLFRFHALHDAMELYTRVGSFDFALNFVAVGAWFAVAEGMRREVAVPTPVFIFVCAALVLFLGRLGSGHFIYAGF